MIINVKNENDVFSSRKFMKIFNWRVAFLVQEHTFGCAQMC